MDIKALKQQVSIMRTKLKKAEGALESCTDEAEKTRLQVEIDSLRQRHEEARAAHEKAEQALMEKAAQAVWTSSSCALMRPWPAPPSPKRNGRNRKPKTRASANGLSRSWLPPAPRPTSLPAH